MRLSEAKAKLEKHRGRTDIRLYELVAIANHLICLVVPEQPSERVAETLNERTLRYYITEGLIDRPSGKEGTAALYGYRHLLQVLAVKLLQGNYLPIKHIREFLADRSNDEIEMILAGGLEEPVTNLRSAISRRLGRLQLGQMATPSRRRLLLQESELPLRSDWSRLAPPYLTGPPSAAGVIWERFVLGDGVELHVRSDRKEELRGSEIRRVVERLLQSLKDK
jgi:DNA-binding transcriptional MerR regulator